VGAKIRARFKKIQDKLPEMFGKVAQAESSTCETFLFIFVIVAPKFGRIENFAPIKSKVPVSLW